MITACEARKASNVANLSIDAKKKEDDWKYWKQKRQEADQLKQKEERIKQLILSKVPNMVDEHFESVLREIEQAAAEGCDEVVVDVWRYGGFMLDVFGSDQYVAFEAKLLAYGAIMEKLKLAPYHFKIQKKKPELRIRLSDSFDPFTGARGSVKCLYYNWVISW